MLPPGVCLSPQLMLLWVSSRKEATIDGAAQIENRPCLRVVFHNSFVKNKTHFSRIKERNINGRQDI